MKLPIVKTSIQVRYSDLDPLGHVSNNIYSQYLELARIEWANAIDAKVPMVVVASTSINFIKEICFNDNLFIVTSCTKKGSKSLTISQDIFSNDVLVTQSTVVLVGIDVETRKTCLVLEGWQASSIESI